jgi:hypothetical protein
MCQTNLFVAAAALIVPFFAAWAASGTASIGSATPPPVIEQSSVNETVGRNLGSIVPKGASRLSEPPQLWGSPDRGRQPQGPCLPKKYLRRVIDAGGVRSPGLDGT